MRLFIQHDLVLAFEAPARALIGVLRLTPRSHEAHHVIDWRVDVEADCQIRTGEDAFGNLVHSFSIDGPLDRLAIHVEGEVETFDAAGVVRGAAERFPPELFLRDNETTAAAAPLRAIARECTAGIADDLGKLHALMDRLHLDAAKSPAQDLAHQFTGAARFLGIPARFVSGYFSSGGMPDAVHCWSEAHTGELGWIGFDPVNGICPQESHIRLGCGLDVWSAAPWRFAQANGSPVAPQTRLAIRQAGVQTQS